MSNLKKPLRIDIVSDVVCPWCAIGYSTSRGIKTNQHSTRDSLASI